MKIAFDIVRRRYGRAAWFSWVHYRIGDGERQELRGDPWPAHTPPRKEIRAAIAQEIGNDSFELTHQPRKRKR